MVDISARAARALAIALAAIAAGLLPGCASITGTELQLLSLQASDKDGAPVAGADCRLSNDKGTWHAKPPASATVLRSAEDLMVSCEAAGRAPGTVRAVSRANAGMAGNIIFGGIIGAVIDHSRGTAYDYPSMIGVVFGASRTIDKNDEFGPSPPASAAPAPSPGPNPASQNTPTAALAADGPNAPASAALPAIGSRFRYAWTEQQYGRRRQEFEVRITGVDGWMVMESFSVAGGRPARIESSAQSLAFASRLLAESQTLVEFAPYLQSRDDTVSLRIADPSGYATDAMGSFWDISVRMRGQEPVTVPAGTFNALRVDVHGARTMTTIATSAFTGRFEFTAWYVPDLKRYVQSRHRTWNPAQMAIGDELVELLEYRPN